MNIATGWFARVGQALTATERAAIDAMLRLHPLLADAEVAAIGDWRDVPAVLADAQWDTRWTDHEVDERERLWQLSAERMGEQALFAAVQDTTESIAVAVRDAARLAALTGGVRDARLVDAAAGGALLAVQHEFLAREAGELAAHFFTPQWALYCAGRWPLGLHRGRYCVF